MKNEERKEIAPNSTIDAAEKTSGLELRVKRVRVSTSIKGGSLEDGRCPVRSINDN